MALAQLNKSLKANTVRRFILCEQAKPFSLLYSFNIPLSNLHAPGDRIQPQMFPFTGDQNPFWACPLDNQECWITVVYQSSNTALLNIYPANRTPGWKTRVAITDHKRALCPSGDHVKLPAYQYSICSGNAKGMRCSCLTGLLRPRNNVPAIIHLLPPG